jgi:POT family proton-dependent oligopeptide transporter
MATAVQQTEDYTEDRRFFGHPLPLAQLFGLEMWERFSYYGMTGILALYLYFSVSEGGVGLAQPTALAIVGAYGGAVFLATVLGSWVADRLLGSETVLFWSAVVIMAGHIALALLPGLSGVAVGLVLVALGSGGLKATASAVVGSLYSEQDSRREAGFSIFYMGVNIGALLGPLLTGLLQKTIGFHIAFGLAALGMAIGLGIYLTGRKNLPSSAGFAVNPLPRRQLWVLPASLLAVIVVVTVLWTSGLMNDDNLATWTVCVSAGAAVAYFTVILRSRQTTAVEKSRTLAFIPYFIASAAFWSLYQQIFNVMTAYSETQMNRTILGWEFPINWIQLIPPIFVIALAPVASAIWLKLGDRQPSSYVKAGISLAIIGGAYLLFLPYACGVQCHTAALGGAHHGALRRGGAAALPHRPLAVHAARTQGLHLADDRPVLPVLRRGHRALRRVLHVLRRPQPGAVLDDAGSGLDRPGRRRPRRGQALHAAHARRALSGVLWKPALPAPAPVGAY